MFKLRQEQYDQLAKIAFERYICRLADFLQEPAFTDARNRWFPKAEHRQFLEDVVRQLVQDAERFGLVYEDDVTPFVLLSFALPELCRDGLEDSVNVLLQASEIVPGDRIKALHHILPEETWPLIFR